MADLLLNESSRSNGRVKISLGEVHVWILDAGDDKRAWDYVLSSDEAATAVRLTGLERVCFKNRRGALRFILGKYLDLNPAAIKFVLGPNGKPYLAGSELCFNLAHSGDIAAIVVALSCQVGIDIEELRAIENCHEIADQFFEAKEIDALSRLTPPMLNRSFLTTWVRKEAVLKAAGMGIASGLPVAVPMHERLQGSKISLRCAGQSRFYLYEIVARPGFVGALAVSKRPICITERTFERNEGAAPSVTFV